VRCPSRDLLRLLLASLLLIHTTSDATEQARGQVEVRVTDHQAGIEDFRSLPVAIAEIALHRRGADMGASLLVIINGLRLLRIGA
jgi:hypothetical protein